MAVRADEMTGACYAVFFAMACVMLFTLGALSVDIGNAVSRRPDIQRQADYGAYAAAAAASRRPRTRWDRRSTPSRSTQSSRR